jgi:hypothetical protein
MATYSKFNAYTENLANGLIDWDTNTFKVMLCNTAPVATNSVRTDLTEIAGGNGYTANSTNTGGGTATTITVTRSGGTTKAVGTDVVFTAAGGTIGPFRYAVLYQDNLASTVDYLVAWWDYGSSITLNSGETFTVDFDATNGIWQLT